MAIKIFIFEFFTFRISIVIANGLKTSNKYKENRGHCPHFHLLWVLREKSIESIRAITHEIFDSTCYINETQ